MRAFWHGAGVTLVLACAAAPGYAQKATEQYIPIGQSPGLSGIQTYLGAITGRSASSLTITVADSGGPRTLRISSATRIWLDRSKLKQSNVSGSFSDLQTGRRVEVKFVNPQRRDAAEWVKVEITD